MLNETDTIHGPMEFQKAVDRMVLGGEAKTINTDDYDLPYFLPGTILPVIKINFVFQGAGMGDYISDMPAIMWNAKNCPWIHGRLFVLEMFNEFASNILAEFKEWKVLPVEKINHLIEPNSLMRAPGITMNGVKYAQLANGTGGHLVDVGFMWFSNIFPVPLGCDLFPEIKWDGYDKRLPDGLSPQSYVVLTPGSVSLNRTVPGQYWNPIIEHIMAKGLTPVVLGKSEIVKNFRVNFPEGMDYSKVMDLRDKTTMMEAAWIMKNSAVTIGLDNGLINLAACTDASIVCAYNMVHPDHRRPRRRSGKWREIFLSRAELACTGCQSNMKNMFPHTFNRCLYGHNRCVHMLFENQAVRWTKVIDEILA